MTKEKPTEMLYWPQAFMCNKINLDHTKEGFIPFFSQKNGQA